MPPLVSVIVPVFNCRPTLQHSINSLLNQTLEKIELIIVDDASTDGSADEVDSLAAKDSRITVLHNPVNEGVHRSRSRGVEAATAHWIGFLDADDIARPNMYSKMFAAGEREGAEIVVCGAYRTASERKPVAKKVYFRTNKTITTNVLKRFCDLEFGTGMLWNKLFRRETIQQHFSTEFPWRQDINEDMIVNIGCFADAKVVHVMKDILYEYVLRDDSASAASKPVSAFVQTYRAYAIAVTLFRDRGDDILGNITGLYRRQLSWPAYRVTDPRAFRAFREQIAEANELVTASYPEGLAALAVNQPPPSRQLKARPSTSLRRLLSRFR